MEEFVVVSEEVTKLLIWNFHEWETKKSELLRTLLLRYSNGHIGHRSCNDNHAAHES